jgi:hypothetical protein
MVYRGIPYELRLGPETSVEEMRCKAEETNPNT